MKNRVLSLLLVLGLCAVVSQQSTARPDTPPESPVRAEQTPAKTATGQPEWVLSHTPEAFNGEGCVVGAGSYGIVAAHTNPWFQLIQRNCSGKLLKNVKCYSGGKDGGRVAIYRLVRAGQTTSEELVTYLDAPPSPSFTLDDVQPGAMISFINFSWDGETTAPAGDYVARTITPVSGVEVRFSLPESSARAPAKR